MRDPITEGAVGRPPGPLRPFVDRYLGYRLENHPPGIHRGLPSRHLTFIISLADRVDIAAMPDPRRQGPVALHAFAAGFHAGPAAIAHDGNQHGIALELTPLGARALFGLPAGELAGLVVDLPELLGPEAAHLPEQLATRPTWAERFARLDELLLRRIDGDRTLPTEVGRAWATLVATGGRVDIAGLARDVGWSRRHLTERFRAELGLAPKVAARVLRFDRSKRLLERDGGRPLADVAVTAGYYDQAHLARDWRELAGCPPSQWLTDDLPSVQAGEADALAS